MYSTWLELPIFEEIRCQTWLKKNFILRKILLHKRSRTCKSFFTLHSSFSYPTSSKAQLLQRGLSSHCHLLSSSDIQTGSHPLQLCTPRDGHPRVGWFWPQVLPAKQNYGRANSIAYLKIDTLVDNSRWKGCITVEKELSVCWNKTKKKQEADEDPKTQEKCWQLRTFLFRMGDEFTY